MIDLPSLSFLHRGAVDRRLRLVLSALLLGLSLASCAKPAEHRVSRSRPSESELPSGPPPSRSASRPPSRTTTAPPPANQNGDQIAGQTGDQTAGKTAGQTGDQTAGKTPGKASGSPVSRGDTLAITFFDIGQGDAALVVTPAGKRILIDGGPPEGASALVAALSERQIDRLDLVLLSHPHLDHLAGLRRVAEQIPISTYMDSGYESTSPPYQALLKTLAERGVPVKQAKRGRTIDAGGGAELLLLAPPEPFLDRSRSEVNANSVVVRLTWRGRSVLFTGDAEPETERWLLSQYGPAASPPPANGAGGALLSADVLKVAHHGGKYSSTATFLAAVHPQLAVISCAAVNDYGHPTAEALGRLEKVGARILRTDQLGHITLSSRGGQDWVVQNQPATPENPHAAPNPRSSKAAKDEP